MPFNRKQLTISQILTVRVTIRIFALTNNSPAFSCALRGFELAKLKEAIIENIILLGIPGELRQVLGLVPPPTAAADTKQ